MKFSTLITLTVASTLAILSKSDAVTPACSGKCPSVIAPVCAQNSAGVTHTWANSCELAKSNCKAPNDIYTQISTGECLNDMSKRGIFDGPQPVPGCVQNCPSVISPVCAQNNAGVQATFANTCRLSIAECQYPDEKWTQISRGQCINDMSKRGIVGGPLPVPGCPQKCPSVISPVCAQNQAGTQKTFVNSCRMSIVNCEYPADPWTIVENKSCGDLSKRSIAACPQKCPDVLLPVCGQDKTGKQATFGNSCRLSVAQCMYPTEGWTQVSGSTCAGDLD
ncbi:hypothetical protein BGX30_014233 [Mortierella sp. GBA39]|nr:hypothetical protein BGX30_014233 [Mortierella sp. GBA39]